MNPFLKKLIFILVLFFSVWVAVKLFIMLDKKIFQEKFRDVYGLFIAQEDWSNAAILPVNMNYNWLNVEKRPLRIGHALGFSGMPLGNHLEALPHSKKLLLNILEVDLWLAEDNSVRCFHGPGDPGPLLEKTCTFERLLSATEQSGEFIILDIKTDFQRTAVQINAILEKMPSQRRRVVFQLYRPNDINIFSTFYNLESYPGPILTAYVSRASLNTLALSAKRVNIRALTIPVQRQTALNRKMTEGLHLFVHPVHTCSDLLEAVKNSYDGIYTSALLSC